MKKNEKMLVNKRNRPAVIRSRCIAARLAIIRAGIPALVPPPPDSEEMERTEKYLARIRHASRRKNELPARRESASTAFFSVSSAGNEDLSIENEPFAKAFLCGFNS